MLEDHPLERGFGTTAGRFFRRVLEEHGVEVIGGDEVARFEGDERVERVVTAGRARAAAQAVICGVGAMPDVMLARKAGLTLGELGGVLCDSRLRTSAEGIYAAGDMCEYDSVVHGRVVRIEHEEVAAAQGATAARNMLGRRRRARRGPLLLLRPLRLGLARVPRPGLRLGRRAGRGLDRRRRVRRLVPRGRSGAGDAERRRRGRPRPRARAHQGLATPRAVERRSYPPPQGAGPTFDLQACG